MTLCKAILIAALSTIVSCSGTQERKQSVSSAPQNSSADSQAERPAMVRGSTDLEVITREDGTESGYDIEGSYQECRVSDDDPEEDSPEDPFLLACRELEAKVFRCQSGVILCSKLVPQG